MRSPVLVPLFVFVASCGSSETPVSALSTGTANLDTTFTFMPSHAPAWSAASMGTRTSPLSIVVSNTTGADECSPLRFSNRTTAKLFRLSITELPGANLPPGTYAVGESINAAYVLGDGACATKSAGAATSGTVELDRVGPAILGIANLTFPAGRMIAMFNAPVCDPANDVTDAGLACVGAPGR